jgi:predicted SprT family Zn-dependent metalloprotease
LHTEHSEIKIFFFKKKFDFSKTYLYENLHNQLNSLIDHDVFHNNVIEQLHRYVQVQFQVNLYHDDDDYRLKMMNKVLDVFEKVFQAVDEQNVWTVEVEYLLKLNVHVHRDHDLQKNVFRSNNFFQIISPRPRLLLT